MIAITLSWIDTIVTYVKSRFHMNQVSNQQESETELHLQSSNPNYIECNEIEDTQGSRNGVDTTAECNKDIVNSPSITILKDILKAQLEDIQEINVKQFSQMTKIIEGNEMNHKEQYNETVKRVEEIYDELKEKISFQHRETSKRLELLENKIQIRYFY